MNQTFLTPILFLVFNRPENTRIVFNEIKKIKPQKLYIAADGPRENNLNDKINCLEVRRIIDEQIDWNCEVKKLFRDDNLGCKLAVSEAISWFFENEEHGIILEDDCLPDQTFFWFCEELLNKYENDKRVMMISGMNYAVDNLSGIPESYFFSNYYTIWGWATWRRAWKLYDIEMKNWEIIKDSGFISSIYNNKKLENFIKSILQEAYENKTNTWDIQWFYTCLINNGLTAMPKINLISNIGVEGVHANSKNNMHYLPIKSLDYNNLVHPKIISANKSYNILLYKKISSLITGQNLFIMLKHMYKKLFGINEISQRKIAKFIKNYYKKNKVEIKNLHPNTITVIIPCYNHANYLKKCFESVVNQTEHPDEIIIIDDFSSDNTKDIVRDIFNNYGEKLNIKIFYNDKNIGQCGSLNKAIMESSSELIFILNDDDYLFFNAIEILKKLFKLYNDVALIGSTSIHFSSNEFINRMNNLMVSAKFENLVLTIHTPENLLKYRNYNDLNMTHSGCTFYKRVWEYVGGYFPDKKARLVFF
ncbi:MAG: glycosyltransferase family 2 protein, partial [Nitrososphaeraceae archaeon]|nr:glycosyltransferase family 2 protein [Nitrososphaeraceae archaeon]